jgi:hypothetical protein
VLRKQFFVLADFIVESMHNADNADRSRQYTKPRKVWYCKRTKTETTSSSCCLQKIDGKYVGNHFSSSQITDTIVVRIAKGVL